MASRWASGHPFHDALGVRDGARARSSVRGEHGGRATDALGCCGHGHSPFSVVPGWSVVFRFVEFGVLLMKCRPLFPESGFVSVKSLFEFRESLAFSCKALLVFRQRVLLLGRSATCSQRRGLYCQQSRSSVGERFILCKQLVFACSQSVLRRLRRVADCRCRLACRSMSVSARWISSFLV